MKHSLAARLPIIAAIALAVAATDRALKTWAPAALRPDQIVFNSESTWHAVVVLPVIGVFLIVVARTRLLALSAGSARSLNADALQARDPLHGHRRRTRRQGHALP
jgi:hypothetical protein